MRSVDTPIRGGGGGEVRSFDTPVRGGEEVRSVVSILSCLTLLHCKRSWMGRRGGCFLYCFLLCKRTV